MEHQPTQQTVVQPTNEPVEEVPHVLHPEHQSVASSEKVVDNFQRFDIATAQSMIQPGSKPQEQGLGEPVVEQVEEPGAGQALESGQEAEPRERESKVLRPENWITEKIKQRIRALATAGMVGLSGAGVTDANAIELRGVKETAAVLGVGILNKTVLSQTPVAVVLDQKGNPVVIPKTPGQQAMTTPASDRKSVV